MVVFALSFGLSWRRQSKGFLASKRRQVLVLPGPTLAPAAAPVPPPRFAPEVQHCTQIYRRPAPLPHHLGLARK